MQEKDTWTSAGRGEEHRYHELLGEQLYVVRHAAAGTRRGTVLMLPALAPERVTSMIPWVRCARHFASHGYEVVRFDPRGVGESSGDFAQTSFESILADASFLLASLCEGPVHLLGLRAGALTAAELFAQGHGDSLLLWEPVADARLALHELLRIRIAMNQTVQDLKVRPTREDYQRTIEGGGSVEVEGHPIGPVMWQSSEGRALRVPDVCELRPWHVFQLGRRPCAEGLPPERVTKLAIPRPPFWARGPLLVPELSELFDRSARFFDLAQSDARQR